MKLLKLFNLVIILPSLAVFACENNNVDQPDYKLSKELILKDSLTIDVPKNIQHLGGLVRPTYTTTNENFSYYVEKGQELIFHTYNRTFKQWSTIRLNKQGNQQVYGKGAFNLNEDGMLFIPFNNPKILKLNNHGIKLSEHKFFSNRNMAFDSKVKKPIISVVNENIYFDLGSYVNLNDPRTFEKTYTVAKYDTITKILEPMIKYPEEYHNKAWSGNDSEHHYVIRGDLIYMNFAKSKYVYSYDKKNGNLINKKLVNSTMIKESNGVKSGDSMENAIAQINNGYYSRIIYDKWRDVFYRVGVYFDVKNEITSPSEVAMAFRKKKILILTFDKDLNILSKNEFDAINNRLNEYYTWITEKGLFMYQFPRDNEENYYQFARFDLQELKS